MVTEGEYPHPDRADGFAKRAGNQLESKARRTIGSITDTLKGKQADRASRHGTATLSGTT